VVTPANPAKRCYPDSVAAHSLYEQPDPNCFYEPEGKIDMGNSEFEHEGERSIKVSGTKLVNAEKNTVKLEGTRLVGYRSITIAGIRDPLLITNIEKIENSVRESVAKNLEGILNSDEYTLRFFKYGLNGVLGELETSENIPHEVGLLIEAIAPEQVLADTILSLARSTALHQHFEGRKTTAGNLAFPFSPSDFHGGEVYEFSIYHLMEVDESDKIFPITYKEVCG
jgi:hypothetical protein